MTNTLDRGRRVYVVDAYPYGCAHDDDGSRATVTTDLEIALDVLADELDAYAEHVHELHEEARGRLCGHRAASVLEPMTVTLDDATDEERQDLEELREHARRSLAFLETFHASALAWARMAGGQYETVAAREYLEGALARVDTDEDEDYRVELVGTIREDVDEPGSLARGMTFVLEARTLGELLPDDVETVDELDELANVAAPSLALVADELADELTDEG